MVRRFKEEHSFVGKAKAKVEVDIPVNGKLTSHDITEEMRSACESITQPIVETTDSFGSLRDVVQLAGRKIFRQSYRPQRLFPTPFHRFRPRPLDRP